MSGYIVGFAFAKAGEGRDRDCRSVECAAAKATNRR